MKFKVTFAHSGKRMTMTTDRADLPIGSTITMQVVAIVIDEKEEKSEPFKLGDIINLFDEIQMFAAGPDHVILTTGAAGLGEVWVSQRDIDMLDHFAFSKVANIVKDYDDTGALVQVGHARFERHVDSRGKTGPWHAMFKGTLL